MEIEDDSELSGWEDEVDVSTRILLSQEEVLRMGEWETLEENSVDDEETRMVESEGTEEYEEMDECSHSDATEGDYDVSR